ncbi:conserved Plasmodium protein, unknown function [Plasmodium sp. gorilla clade G3]|nr:conserved Plasmodium protein, unknown function [Plasmodium sp. gorilla clade G3]
MKSINVKAKIHQDCEELYQMFKSLRQYEDNVINGSIKLKKKNLNEEINRFKDINDKYIFSNVKKKTYKRKKFKLKINGCIKIKKGTHEQCYNQLLKKVLHGNIFIHNKNINNILDYIEYIKYIKLCGKISMIKKKTTDKNDIVFPLLSKENTNNLRYLKNVNDVKKERNQKSPRKSSYNIEKKEILDLSMKRYSHFKTEISNSYNLKNNSFYDNINLDDNKIKTTKVNKEKEKEKEKKKEKEKEKEKNINIYRTNGRIKNTLNNKEFSFVLYPSSNDKIRHANELKEKMNTFKLNIPSSIINKFNKSNNTNIVEERESINYNLIKKRQEFMYKPIKNDKDKHNKIHLKGAINYIKNKNNNNNNSNVHQTKFIFRGKKKKRIIEDEGTNDNYILCNEEKKKLLYLDPYNNETNKSHETYVLSGNKIYNKFDKKNIFLDHSVFLNYHKKVPKRISISCSSKNKDINKSTYDETMLSMSDVDDIDYFMHIKEKNAIKYKDYMNKPKTKDQENFSIEEEKSVLRIKMIEGQEDIKEKKNYKKHTKYKIDKKEPSNNDNMSNIRNKKFSSVSRKLSKPFSFSRSGAIFSMSNKKENRCNKKRTTRLNKENRYMKKYLNKIMNMSILRRNFNNVNSSVFIRHQKCFDKHERDTRINEKKCKKGVIKTEDKKENMNILNFDSNETQRMTKGNKNDNMGDSKNDNVSDSKNDNVSDNKNDNMGDSKNDNVSDSKNDNMGDSKNDNVSDSKNDNVSDNKNDNMGDSKNDNMGDNKNDNTIILSKEKNIKIGIYFEEACDIKQSNDKNISTTKEIKKMGSPVINKLLTKKEGILKKFAITKEKMDITKKEGVVVTVKKSISINKDSEINISNDKNVIEENKLIEKNKVNFTIKSVQNILSKQLFKSKGNSLLINKNHVPKMDSINKMIVGGKMSLKSSLIKKDVYMEKNLLNKPEENYLNDERINKPELSKEDDVDMKEEPVLNNEKLNIIKKEDQNICTNTEQEHEMQEEKMNEEVVNSKSDENTKKTDSTINDKEKTDIINKKSSLESVKEEIMEKEMLDEKDKIVPQFLECNNLHNMDENIKDINVEKCNDYIMDNITNKNNNMLNKKINMKMIPMLNKKALPKSKTLPILLKNNINISKEKFTINKKLSNESTDNSRSCDLKLNENKEEEKQNNGNEKQIIKPSKSIHKMIKPGRHSFFNANKLLNSIEVKIGEHNSKIYEKEGPIKMLSNSASIIADAKIDSMHKSGEENQINDVKTDTNVNINMKENENQNEKGKMFMKKGIPKLMMKFNAFSTKKMGIKNVEDNKKVNSLRSIEDGKTLEKTNEQIDKTDEKIDKTNEKIDKTDEKIDKTNEQIYKTDEKIDKTDEKIDKTNEQIDKTNEKIDKTDEKIYKTDEKIYKTDEKIDKTNEKIDETNDILDKQCEEEVKNGNDPTLQDNDDTQHPLKTTKPILMKKIPQKCKMNTVKMGDIKFPNHMNKFINKFHSVKNLSTLKEFPVKKLIKKDSNEENNSLEKIKMDKEKISDGDMEKEADEDVMNVEESLMDKKLNDETENEMNNNNNNNEMDKNKMDNIQQDNSETSLNKNEEPNLVDESATTEKESVDKIIPRSFSKSLSIPMKVPTIKENINKTKPTFWNKPKGKMFFLTKKEKSISQAKEILKSLEKSTN